MVDSRRSRILGSEKNHFAVLFGELVEGLLAKAVCDAAASILRPRCDLADACEVRIGARHHDAACACEHIAVSF